MAIRNIVTRGFGNGTFDGSISLIVTRGYGIGVAADVAVTGGYTPYAVYDPRHEKKLRDQRKQLRREREELQADLKRLLDGDTAEVPEPSQPDIAAAQPKATTATKAQVNASVLTTLAVSTRRARLEVLHAELAVLDAEFRIIRAETNKEARRLALENEMLAILLMAS